MNICKVYKKEFIVSSLRYIKYKNNSNVVKTCSKECKNKLCSLQTKNREYNNTKYKDIINKKTKCIICNNNIIYKNKYSYIIKKTCSVECKNKLLDLLNKSIEKRNINSLKNKNISYEQKYGLEKSNIIKNKISISQKGKITSNITKQKISFSKKGIKVNNGKKKYFYNNIFFRSKWEIIFAKWCDEKNIKYLYEPKLFKLTNTLNYIPDFYLSEYNMWVEIKGWWSEPSLEKVNLFKDKISNNLWVIDSANIFYFNNKIKKCNTLYHKEYNPTYEEYLLGEFYG